MRLWRTLGRELTSARYIMLCLALSMVLVVAGTLAQVELGTYAAQKAFFGGFWVWWRAPWGMRLPVLPGGLTVGLLWGAGLIATLVFHFKYSWKNAGLLLAHLGLLLLLAGQLLTQLLARETQMAVSVGQSLNYSESAREFELALTDGSDPRYDEVTAIPASRLRPGTEVRAPRLPFTLRVQSFARNAAVGMARGAGAASRGVGQRVSVQELPPAASDDESDQPATVVEAVEGGRSLGTWLVSPALGAPQSIHAGSRDYQLALRPARRYLPFTLTLRSFRHEVYPGTDVPKDFTSFVRLTRSAAREDRSVLIYMNHPLRYLGRTFYQASFGDGDRLSVLQVVENPVWLTPYLSCALVLLGLGAHFILSLSKLSRRPA